MSKHGFVYIWFDRKHKRYYIGCRWGRENDGYICSSPWMKKSYKRRPQDFQRRIIRTNIQNRNDLLEEEYRWLSKIKDDELGKRYYNLHNHHFNHWSIDESKRSQVSKKLSDANKGKPSWNKGISPSEETRKKISEAQKGRVTSEETKKKQSEANKGKSLSQEHVDKIQKSRQWWYEHGHTDDTKEKIKATQFQKGYHPDTQFKKDQCAWNKGIPMSDEAKQKMIETKRSNKYNGEY